MGTLVIVDGGPRKGWNTAQMLGSVSDGATSAGAEVRYFRLFDLDARGCSSCFACKRKGVFLDCCAQRDGLRPVLEAVYGCDALVVGSPVYFGDVTGATRNFIERVCFPYISYDELPSHFGRQIETALICTTNAPAAEFDQFGYLDLFAHIQQVFSRIFGRSQTLCAAETLQFDDYSKYAAGRFDAQERLSRHETVFKDDLQKAFDLGIALMG
ncbi:MAG: flavodoxin family protein [Coriobacteriales bacterium]|jgi:multimeric flavodoxin WrbA|nr:flavodoxin family protein [Coriobacteriales bacterium]